VSMHYKSNNYVIKSHFRFTTTKLDINFYWRILILLNG